MSKTVIFDFDGTLADTLEIILKLYNQEAARFKADPVTIDEIPKLQELGYVKAARYKHVRWSVIPRLVLHISGQLEDHIDEAKAFPGIVNCLEALQKKGYRLGVLTSNEEKVVKKFFVIHRFPKFDFIVSEKALFGKDKALRRILKQHHLSPGQVVCVGDEPRDVTACRKTGIKVIGVSWGLAGVKGFEHDPPDVLVHTATELESILLAK